MQRIAQGALERISGEPTVHLHVPDRWLDRTAPVDHGLQDSGDPSPLARHQHAHPFDLHPPVAPVYHRRLWLAVGASEEPTCSKVSASVWPSYGLPGMDRMPTTSPSLCVVAMLTFTPNS